MDRFFWVPNGQIDRLWNVQAFFLLCVSGSGQYPAGEVPLLRRESRLKNWIPRERVRLWAQLHRLHCHCPPQWCSGPLVPSPQLSFLLLFPLLLFFSTTTHPRGYPATGLGRASMREGYWPVLPVKTLVGKSKKGRYLPGVCRRRCGGEPRG